MTADKVRPAKQGRVRKWIDEGRDPATARWQAALEDMLDVFMPLLEPGKLVPVHPLNDADLPVFLAAMEIIDLSPGLPAVFLPPAIAEKVVPPESLKPIARIAAGRASYKIFIARPGENQRILCAEISEEADKPGVEIFQSGALLGTYDYKNQKDCLDQLTKIIRVHLWDREKWTRDDYRRYTVNWFEKVMDLHKGSVCVEKAFSFFHSPTLIKADRIDALFLLILEIIEKRLHDVDDPLNRAIAAIGTGNGEADAAARSSRLTDLLDQAVFELLTLIKDCDLFAFDTMTNRESDQFNRESARIVRKLAGMMQS
ncbi:MAG: hypothetical protein COX19_16065 [Desulfobacterales bacterium CG23_combo_of_CG06-09_8_20_14_all_51_8]|nr:MAG: hypothetical protein COX19_16065 [Desulfobacterales bacterium CG23_combo_of_CG06-09_8_20_14_all_51_8]